MLDVTPAHGDEAVDHAQVGVLAEADDDEVVVAAVVEVEVVAVVEVAVAGRQEPHDSATWCTG